MIFPRYAVLDSEIKWAISDSYKAIAIKWRKLCA
jgi:hypothetical protein